MLWPRASIDPDIQGTYTSDNSIGLPFERPAQFARQQGSE